MEINIENIAETLLIKLEEFKIEWKNSTNHTFKNKIILSENFLHSKIHGINYIIGITDSLYFKLKVSDIYYMYFFDFFSNDFENIETIKKYKKYQKKLWKIEDILNFIIKALKPSEIALKLNERHYNQLITNPLNKIKLILENIHNNDIKISDKEYFINDSWKYFNLGYYLLNSKWLNKVPNEIIFKNKNDLKSNYFLDNEAIKHEDYLTALYFFEKAIKINKDFLLAKIYRLVALINYDSYEGGYVSEVYNDLTSIIEENPRCSIAHIHLADFCLKNETYFWDNKKNDLSIDVNKKIKKHINFALKYSKHKSSYIYYKTAIIENFRYKFKSSISFLYEAQSLQESSKTLILLKSAELNNEESDNMRFMKLETILNSEIPIYTSQYYYWIVWNELYSLKNFKELFDIDHEGYENMLIKYSSYSRKNQNLYNDYSSFKDCNCKIDITSLQIKITIDESYSNIIESNKLLFFDLCMSMQELQDLKIINSQIHLQNIEYKIIDDLIILKKIKNLDSLFIN